MCLHVQVQRTVPELQSQLEEYKSTLCQLQAQKQRLQTEVVYMVTMTTSLRELLVSYIDNSKYIFKRVTVIAC